MLLIQTYKKYQNSNIDLKKIKLYNRLIDALLDYEIYNYKIYDKK